MFRATIQNPDTQRTLRVVGWHVQPKEVLGWVKEGLTAKDISWKFLNDRKVEKLMKSEEYGDCSSNNFALSVFENALDWSIGLCILRLIRGCVANKKIPKPFDLLVDRKGTCYAKLSSGRVITL